MHATGSGLFEDVAGIVDADEEKRDAACIRGVQAGQTVADLLETRTKPAAKEIEVIAQVTGRREESIIGHHHRAGEVASKRLADQRSRGAVIHHVRVRQTVNQA